MKKENISMFWLAGPPLAIAALAAALYLEMPWARNWVDDKFPQVKDLVGSHIPAFETQEAAGPPAPPRAVPVAEIVAPTAHQQPPSAPAVSAPAPAPAEVASPPDGLSNLQRLAADRAAWPKTVAVKKPVEFPAVLNGKVIGKVKIAAGAEANLVAITNTQVGLEYRGGGAWIKLDDTDLLERAKLARQ